MEIKMGVVDVLKKRGILEAEAEAEGKCVALGKY